ncbi:hypothetical protein CW360_14095 [Pseudomonas fluvialis]|uniref:HTH cro/C1-type domain-containing protein n=1 Tax=Pseudomonas fluvialis TaxID=1793966 RepID=A0A2I0CMN5_9PSED|nr:hypothetical protein CW360_14095 [Pseudomonas pharmacofabricae]
MGFSQTEFAALAGASKHSQINWEKGAAAPNATVLGVLAEHGLDVLYVVTGQRLQCVTEQSHVSTSTHVTEKANPVTHSGAVPQIDADRLARIVELLERFAAQAGKRWPAKRLVVLAAEVYNVLADEPALDEPKVERILKLVVSR